MKRKYWWYETQWYIKHNEAMQINGKGKRTRKAYSRALRMLVEFYDKEPDQITEDELQQYFLHRKTKDNWAPNTMRIAYCEIKFFFEHVIQRDWHILGILRAKNEQRLPAVLSRDEIKRIFSRLTTFHNYVYLTTVYSCGLRLQEGLFLEVSDIDSDRMMIHVHRGKGAKDRYVPLPEQTLPLLRKHWANHRHPRLIFPALGRNGKGGPRTLHPMAIASVQGGLSSRQMLSRYPQKARHHPYATPLLCHTSFGGRGQSARHSMLFGPQPARNHHDLSAPDANRA